MMKPELYGAILLCISVTTAQAVAMPVTPDLPNDLSSRFAQTTYAQIPEVKKASADDFFSQAPDPGSYGLFGTGLLGLAFIRHRREPYREP